MPFEFFESAILALCHIGLELLVDRSLVEIRLMADSRNSILAKAFDSCLLDIIKFGLIDAHLLFIEFELNDFFIRVNIVVLPGLLPAMLTASPTATTAAEETITTTTVRAGASVEATATTTPRAFAVAPTTPRALLVRI